jgi:hypothetical protein
MCGSNNLDHRRLLRNQGLTMTDHTAAPSEFAARIEAITPIQDEAIESLYKGMYGPLAYCAGFRDARDQAVRACKDAAYYSPPAAPQGEDDRIARALALEALTWHYGKNYPGEPTDIPRKRDAKALRECKAALTAERSKLSKIVGWFKYDKVSQCYHPQYEKYVATHAEREGWVQLCLADTSQQERAKSNPWRDAIDDALVCAGLDCTSPDDSPRDAIYRLVQWQVQIALDPAVSGEAQALIDRGAAEERAKSAAVLADAERWRWARPRLHVRQERSLAGIGGYRDTLSIRIAQEFFDTPTRGDKGYLDKARFAAECDQLDAAIDAAFAAGQSRSPTEKS